MIATEIESLAGRLTAVLGRRGPLGLTSLWEALAPASPVAVVMALGWLVRDDRITIGNRSNRVVVMARRSASPVGPDGSVASATGVQGGE